METLCAVAGAATVAVGQLVIFVAVTANPCCQRTGAHCLGLFGPAGAFRDAQRLIVAAMAQHVVDVVRRLQPAVEPSLLMYGVVNGNRLLRAPTGGMRPTASFMEHAKQRRGRRVGVHDNLLPERCASVHYIRELAASAWALVYGGKRNLVFNGQDHVVALSGLLCELEATERDVEVALRTRFAPACVTSDGVAAAVLAVRRRTVWLRVAREGPRGAEIGWRAYVAPEHLAAVVKHLSMFRPSGRRGTCSVTGAISFSATAILQIGVEFKTRKVVTRVDLESHTIQIYVKETELTMRLVYCKPFEALLRDAEGDRVRRGQHCALVDYIFGGPRHARAADAPSSDASGAGAVVGDGVRAPLELLGYLESNGATGYPAAGAASGIAALRTAIGLLPARRAPPPLEHTVLPFEHPYDGVQRAAAARGEAAAAMEKLVEQRGAHYDPSFSFLSEEA